MNIRIGSYEDAAAFSAAAQEFLLTRPVEHNLILTLLDERLTGHEPGRYWVAAQDGEVAGVVFQSPLTRPALLSPMEDGVIASLVDAMADARLVLPGVMGEVATAARFAGEWTERGDSAAIPSHGLRLYELAQLKQPGPVKGELRKAEVADRNLAVSWVQEFHAEVHDTGSAAESLVDVALASGRLWFWQNGEAMAMAVGRKPIAGVVRVSHVYTPPGNRKRGYAAACVYGMSKHFTDAGRRCILYADLGNPSSNSIYRRIGYRAVAEAIQYRFESR